MVVAMREEDERVDCGCVQDWICGGISKEIFPAI